MYDGISVGIITYNYNHLKTEQVVRNIVKRGYKPTLYLLPFVKKNERNCYFQHRPNQFSGISPKQLACELSLRAIECDDDSDITNAHDYFIITGAGILSKQCINQKRIINCHPGIIPLVRGLDAFKWTIYYGLPLGNTIYYIDENIDLGKTIARIRTPIKKDDTITSLAERHYNSEIDILSNFDKYIFIDEVDRFSISANPPIHKANRRMPIELEQVTVQRFEEYKRKYSE